MIAKCDTRSSCGSCRYFDLLIDHEEPDNYGVCLRNPPQFVEPGALNGGWPVIQSHQWCGEYKSDADCPSD